MDQLVLIALQALIQILVLFLAQIARLELSPQVQAPQFAHLAHRGLINRTLAQRIASIALPERLQALLEVQAVAHAKQGLFQVAQQLIAHSVQRGRTVLSNLHLAHQPRLEMFQTLRVLALSPHALRELSQEQPVKLSAPVVLRVRFLR